MLHRLKSELTVVVQAKCAHLSQNSLAPFVALAAHRGPLGETAERHGRRLHLLLLIQRIHIVDGIFANHFEHLIFLLALQCGELLLLFLVQLSPNVIMTHRAFVISERVVDVDVRVIVTNFVALIRHYSNLLLAGLGFDGHHGNELFGRIRPWLITKVALRHLQRRLNNSVIMVLRLRYSLVL